MANAKLWMYMSIYINLKWYLVLGHESKVTVTP